MNYTLKKRAHDVMKRILAKPITTETEKDACSVISDLLHEMTKKKPLWKPVSEYDYEKCPTVIAAKEITNEKTGASYWRVAEACYSEKSKSFHSCDTLGSFPWSPDIFASKPVPEGCQQISDSCDYTRQLTKKNTQEPVDQ